MGTDLFEWHVRFARRSDRMRRFVEILHRQRSDPRAAPVSRNAATSHHRAACRRKGGHGHVGEPGDRRGSRPGDGARHRAFGPRRRPRPGPRPEGSRWDAGAPASGCADGTKVVSRRWPASAAGSRSRASDIGRGVARASGFQSREKRITSPETLFLLGRSQCGNDRGPTPVGGKRTGADEG